MKNVLIALLLLAGTAHAASVQFEPLPLEVGRAGRLTIRLDGDAAQRPPTPRVPGLDLTLAGRSSRIQVIDGALTATTEYVYRVVAQRPGDYVIPSVQVGGERTAAVDVPVVAAAASPRADAAPEDADASEGPRTAFLRFYLPDEGDGLRVGETTPIVVRAYFRPDAQVTVEGRPELETDGFTVDGLEQLDQGEHTVRGERYLTATWRGTLTAVKEGAHAITASLPATVRWRDRSRRRPRARRRSPFDDPFFRDPFGAGSPFGAGGPFGQLMDDPFFGSAFDADPFAALGGALQQRSLTLRAGRKAVEVAGLPTEGRPDTFDGAVGQFTIEATLDDARTTVGEPRTLTVTITGEGNFDQVRTAGAASTDTLRAYPVAAGASPAGRAGAKVFTQPVVARADGDVTIPPVAFTFFDPQADAYRTVETRPLTLHATPAAGASPAAPPSVAAGAPAPSTDHHGALAAPWTQATFWALPGGALALSLLMIVGVGLRRWRRDPTARSRRAERAALRRMRRAARRRQAADFLLAAQRAAQHHFGRAWGVESDAITGHEIAARLPDAGALLALFEAADRVRFGGGVDAVDYTHWRRALRAALKEDPA